MSFCPRRSALYVPATNVRALEKAKLLNVDCLIIDLEDAVSPNEKQAARENLRALLREAPYENKECIIRVNSLQSEWGEEDLLSLHDAGHDGFLIPKVKSGDDLRQVDAVLGQRASNKPKLWAMLETPMAILNVQDIMAVIEDDIHLTACVMGANDLAKETGVSLEYNRLAMQPWLMQCVAAARAYNISILDGVFNRLKDEDGFKRECEQGAVFGMDGKTLIHPNQINACHKAFTPSIEEIEQARMIVAAFNLPENQNKGVIALDGNMVERLHADMAQALLEKMDVIEKRKG